MTWETYGSTIKSKSRAQEKAFSDAGDSGSLIVDDQLRAIGLLFAGGDEGGSNKKGLTYANPIEQVLDGATSRLGIMSDGTDLKTAQAAKAKAYQGVRKLVGEVAVGITPLDDGKMAR